MGSFPYENPIGSSEVWEESNFVIRGWQQIFSSCRQFVSFLHRQLRQFVNRQPNEGVSIMKPSAFIIHLMARGKRMEAWPTQSSRQPSPSVSSMWSSVCFWFPPTSRFQRAQFEAATPWKSRSNALSSSLSCHGYQSPQRRQILSPSFGRNYQSLFFKHIYQCRGWRGATKLTGDLNGQFPKDFGVRNNSCASSKN